MRTVFVSLSLFLAFCSFGYPSDKTSNTDHKTFGDYWYQGKAEITSYEMEQARYGEIRKGHAVLIFVTEDFSKSKQVKLDNPQKDPEDAVKILKLNFVRKFITGIYPYSIMTSVFTPVELSSHPNTLKLSFSSQEWCGNVHTQANHKKNRYEFNSYSYFESEGDAKFELEDAILEDELWTRIRISPDRLPVGNIKIIPSLLSSRLKHFELKVENAFAEKVVIDVPIKHGAAVVLIGEDLGKQPSALASIIADQAISSWYSTPSILRLLVEHGDLASWDYSALKTVIFAGVKNMWILTRGLGVTRRPVIKAYRSR